MRPILGPLISTHRASEPSRVSLRHLRRAACAAGRLLTLARLTLTGSCAREAP
jgi:hypothetical protein